MNGGTHLLTVQSGQGTTTLTVAPGISVREALDTTALRVRAACGGNGSCAACTVRLLGGQTNPPTVAEFLKLTAEERSAGTRLACQLRLTGNAEILLDHPAPPAAWKSIPPEDLLTIGAPQPALSDHVLGVAVDLGTTHIRVALWDRREGRRIASRRGPNPQGQYGADVLNRLVAARVPAAARTLADLARNAIVEAVRDMLARDVGEVTPMLAEIGQVVIAGNTAMLALLTGRGGEALLAPENWQQRIDCCPPDDPEWRRSWHMPNATIEVLPGVGGFVGSDLLAGLLATGVAEGPAGTLFLDVGTNTEIAVWDGQKIHVTSVPGGPAFECGGVDFGMPAEPGAICAVRRSDGGYVLDVVGGAHALGYCGSGLLDAVAALRADGRLKPSGRFAEPGEAGRCRLDPDNPRTAVSGRAVDAFQRAKAATAAAIHVLLAASRLTTGEIRRLIVCGAFGHHLDLANARALGLLPDLPNAVPELFADATLGGCETLLVQGATTQRVQALTRHLSLINVTLVIGYEDRYIEELRLSPTGAGA